MLSPSLWTFQKKYLPRLDPNSIFKAEIPNTNNFSARVLPNKIDYISYHSQPALRDKGKEIIQRWMSTEYQPFSKLFPFGKESEGHKSPRTNLSILQRNRVLGNNFAQEMWLSTVMRRRKLMCFAPEIFKVEDSDNLQGDSLITEESITRSVNVKIWIVDYLLSQGL